MAKYITKSRYSEDLDMEVDELPYLTVFEPVDGPQPTGLLDAKGNELFRIEEKRRIGFLR